MTGTLGLCFYLHRIHIWDRCKGAAPKPERKGATAMKLITAIVNRRDTSEVCAALTDAGFYFTAWPPPVVFSPAATPHC